MIADMKDWEYTVVAWYDWLLTTPSYIKWDVNNTVISHCSELCKTYWEQQNNITKQTNSNRYKTSLTLVYNTYCFLGIILLKSYTDLCTWTSECYWAKYNIAIKLTPLYNFEYFQEDQHNDNDNHQPSDQKAYATDGQFPGALLQGEKHKVGT